MGTLPNLFVVGAAKSGTTALYQYFRQHPAIFVPESLKELNYMAFSTGLPDFAGPGDKDYVCAKSIVNLADYENLFSARKSQRISADVSPAYLYFPEASRKIAQLCPEAKIVIILRNPVECAFSMYSMMRRDGREPCSSFKEAFERSEERMAAGWEWAWNYKGLFLFSRQVSRYLELFPPSQLFIRRYEDMNDRPERFYAELTDFLGIESIARTTDKQRFNEAPRRGDMMGKRKAGQLIMRAAKVFGKVLPMSLRSKLRKEILEKPAYNLGAEERRILGEHFFADIGGLASALQWDLSAWQKI